MKEVVGLGCLLIFGVAGVVAITECRRSDPARIALLLIVDKSGSMAGRNIEIAKEACIKTAKNLHPKDLIGVLAFDYNPALVLEFTEGGRIEYIEKRIVRLLASGGTRIRPALAEALQLFERDSGAPRCGNERPPPQGGGFALRLKAGSVGPTVRLDLRDIHDRTIRVHQTFVKLLSASFRNVLSPTSQFP